MFKSLFPTAAGTSLSGFWWLAIVHLMLWPTQFSSLQHAMAEILKLIIQFIVKPLPLGAWVYTHKHTHTDKHTHTHTSRGHRTDTTITTPTCLNNGVRGEGLELGPFYF